MPEPLSLYRLQLGDDLGFAEAAELVGYLSDLGITHLYLSPILQARPGSTHGYDVADPRFVSEELGGEAGLRRLADAAAERGLGLVVDIVPNHVGTGAATPLWEQLLAEGRAGPAGRVFDVDWQTPLPGAAGKVVVPVLGDTYGRILHAGELELVEEDGAVRLRYHEHSFPLSPPSQEGLARAGGPGALRGDEGRPETWTRLHGLLEQQHYRLVHWRAGQDLINYRRFFAIDELAAVRVEDEAVFAATHATILRLVGEGVVQGLRIDHPDGLRDPGRYLERLAEATGGLWTVVEKIREPGEELPDWRMAGTTGYEFCNDVLGLFVDGRARAVLDDTDRALAAPEWSYRDRLRAAKQVILDHDLHADVRRLARALWGVAQEHPEVRDVAERDCVHAVANTLLAFDVYRTYVDPETGEAGARDVRRIEETVEEARTQDGRGTPAFLYDFLADVLTGRAGTTPSHLEVLARFQQLSGAVMAKGVEDTFFYRHRRLLAVNEVGGDPDRLGVSLDDFHDANLQRALRQPTGVLVTATHDTKRGEDTRLRMAALSELGERWARAARRWREAHRDLVTTTDRGVAPDAQTASLVYQTLVGVWPLQGEPDGTLRERVQAYVLKAVREAKERTSWRDPDEAFEASLAGFVDALLGDPDAAAFRSELAELAGAAAEVAMVHGLAQVLLRCTAPGVPDTYQGTELWDDSLVDPDNRRVVDFGLRACLLADLDADGDPKALWAERRDGRVKLWVLSRALRARREHPGCVGREGRYEPLRASGSLADHVVAFARIDAGGQALVTVTPRLAGGVGGDARGPVWGDTVVALPAGRWHDLLTGTEHRGGRLLLAELLAVLPVALLRSA